MNYEEGAKSPSLVKLIEALTQSVGKDLKQYRDGSLMICKDKLKREKSKNLKQVAVKL